MRLAACLCVLLAPVAAFAADISDRINPEHTYQTIEHLGASDAWSFQIMDNWTQASRDRVAELLFSKDKGIGLSLWRFNIGAGKQSQTIQDPLRSAETLETSQRQYDWQKQMPQQWFLSAAKQHGVERFLAFANSPPARLTRNGLSNSGSDHTSPTNLKPDAETGYAAYLADILQHFRDQGILSDGGNRLTFDYLSPFNEIQIPWESGQEGCRIDNVTLKRALLAISAELKQRGLTTRLVAPESCNATDMLHPAKGPTTRYAAPFGDYISFFSQDPELAAIVDKTLCHHIYGSETSPNLERWSARLGQRMATLPDWKIWMSEICILQSKRDLTIDSGLNLAKIVHHVFATEGATAFHWWLALSPYDYKDGLIYTDWKKPGDPESVIESKMLWCLGNYSRFIRPGAERVEIEQTPAPSTRPAENTLLRSAYLSKNGDLIAVYLNFGKDAERLKLSLPPEFHGLRSFVTDADRNLKESPTAPLDQWQTLPPRSVVTFVANK